MNLSRILVIAAILAPLSLAADGQTAGTPPASPQAEMSQAPAPTHSQVLATKLLDLAGTSELMAQGFEIGLKPALARMKAQGMPDELINSIHAESKRFFEANFKWEEVEPLIVKLYTDSFTESELRDLVSFYETPTGKMAASLLPTLTQEGAALAMTRIQSKMPEFQQRVGALIQDYKKKASEAAAAAAATVPAPAPVTPPAGQGAHPQ
jgi:hypothetical protein